MMVQQASAKPIRKVTAGALADAAMIIVAFLLKRYAHVDLDASVYTACVLLVGFGVSYFVPPAREDVTGVEVK
jgi:hypothetical protein